MSTLATLFDPPTDATSEELRARLRALADLVARAPVPIAVAHDVDCHFISANDALARLLGVPANVNISLTPGGEDRGAHPIQCDGGDTPSPAPPTQHPLP